MNMTFKRGLEPIKAMEIGREGIIKEWLDKEKITNYTINDDFTIDVDGDVWLEGFHLNDVKNIPDYINFGIVKGKFILTN